MTTIYAAGTNGYQRETFENWDWEANPLSWLNSFHYIGYWRRHCDVIKPERRMLDSGAYSAYHSGTTIDLEALVHEALTGGWDEVVGLDVIGDPDGSIKNLDRMWDMGCVAMPVFHIGDPWEHLEYYASKWPKVGLSCRFGESVKDSLRFYDQCFARAWPCKFHSFGWIARDALIRFPFHTADAATVSLMAGMFPSLTLPGNMGNRFYRLPKPTNLKEHGAQLLHAGFLGQLQFQRVLEKRWGKLLATLDEK